ncbi:MAG: hypothetical protein GY797_19465 [Deltaproteobacteria bacterium]|nr:hypothetical protein [Deltaproteobacteria bacterium]
MRIPFKRNRFVLFSHPIVVLDHMFHMYDFGKYLTESFPVETLFVSNRKDVFEKIDKKNKINVDGIVNITIKNRIEAFKYLIKIGLKSNAGGWFFYFYLYYYICYFLAYTDFYLKVLDPKRVKYVLTLHDQQFHESIVTFVARQKNIPTYTAQHGALQNIELYIPYSNYMFVWGRQAKDKLTKLGISEKRIIISGHPLYDDIILRQDHLKRLEKNKLRRKYHFSEEKLNVTFFTSELGPEKNEALLRCFLLGIKCVPLNSIVKIHPLRDDLSVYKKLVRGSEVSCQISNDCAKPILLGSDLVVSYMSSVSVEAVMLGIPVIMINPFSEDFENDDLLAYAIVCSSNEEFAKSMLRITTDELFFKKLKEESKQKSSYFIGNISGVSTSERVLEIIGGYSSI